jgi:hypothetical protein
MKIVDLLRKRFGITCSVTVPDANLVRPRRHTSACVITDPNFVVTVAFPSDKTLAQHFSRNPAVCLHRTWRQSFAQYGYSMFKGYLVDVERMPYYKYYYYYLRRQPCGFV